MEIGLNIFLEFAYRDDLRTANIIVDDEDGVTCLVIDKGSFTLLINPIDEVRTRYDDAEKYRKKYEIFQSSYYYFLYIIFSDLTLYVFFIISD